MEIYTIFFVILSILSMCRTFKTQSVHSYLQANRTLTYFRGPRYKLTGVSIWPATAYKVNENMRGTRVD